MAVVSALTAPPAAVLPLVFVADHGEPLVSPDFLGFVRGFSRGSGLFVGSCSFVVGCQVDEVGQGVEILPVDKQTVLGAEVRVDPFQLVLVGNSPVAAHQ